MRARDCTAREDVSLVSAHAAAEQNFPFEKRIIMHYLRGPLCAVLLVVVVALAVAAAEEESDLPLCPTTSQNSEEAADLRDALRQTACNLNLTATQMFHSQIRAKHGDTGTRGVR